MLVALGQTVRLGSFVITRERNRKCLIGHFPDIVRKTTEFSSERFMFKLCVGLGLF